MKRVKLIMMVCLLLLGQTYLLAQSRYEVKGGILVFTNPSDGLKYIIDSGSELSFFYRRHDSLKYKKNGRTFYTDAIGMPGFGKKYSIKHYIDDFGPYCIDAVKIKNKLNCIDFDIALGLDFLKKNCVVQDNSTKTIYACKLDTCNLAGYDTIILKRSEGLFYTKLYLEGDLRKYYIDNGMTGELFTSGKYNSQDTNIVKLDMQMETALGTRKMNNVPIKVNSKVELGKNSKLSVLEIRNKFIPRNTIGSILFFQFDKVIFDFSNSRIFVLNPKLRERDKIPTTKFGFTSKNEKLYVNVILHNNYYYKKGLRVGNEVTLTDSILQQQMINNPCNNYKLLEKWLENNKFENLIKNWE